MTARTPTPRTRRRIRPVTALALVSALPASLLTGTTGVATGAAASTRSPATADAVAAPHGAAVWPLAGRPTVLAPFSPPTERWGRGHRGVDLAGVPAQPVVAALAGEITFAGRIAGRGVVVVSHPPTRTTYEPVLAAVEVSDTVEAGTRLGWLHTTGSHCAPAACLHWGWRLGQTYLDPLDLVGGGGVRLLPLWTLPSPLALPTQARGWAWE